MEAVEILQQVAQEVAVCEKCGLFKSRKKSVPGEGPAQTEIMLIGEGPGFYENEQGRPFVGPSGKFLAELLQTAGLIRSEVFIGNVVKCRPPENRDPLPDELAACRPYLERQIAAINPRVIITLGRFSMANFMPGVKISAVHGKPHWMGERLIVPMFHPAAALHQPALRDAVVADFTRLPHILEEARQGPPQARPKESQVKEMREGAAPMGGFSATQPSISIDSPVEWFARRKENDNQADGSDKPVQLSLF